MAPSSDARQSTFPFAPAKAKSRRDPLARELLRFREFGTATEEVPTEFWSARTGPVSVPAYVNEFWTARQRAANPLHEVSYRACFKPQLPRFFLERLSKPGDRVYDPFMGRGTTLLEAALLGREPLGCDANPLAAMLVGPRLTPPDPDAVEARLRGLDWTDPGGPSEGLLAFFHPRTLGRIRALKAYLLARGKAGALDAVDAWIRMVALNRLTGHSPGFLSVYTLPPNQAVSVETQRRINRDRKQTPPERDLVQVLMRKTRSLLKDKGPKPCAPELLTGDAADTPGIPDGSVRLAITSPPFLDVVDYAKDNWLRCWFAGIDPAAVRLDVPSRPADWQAKMGAVFRELGRVLAPGAHLAFEVGEVRGGRLKLEDLAVPAALDAGLEPVLLLIHRQAFTKTAHCWGVSNNEKGTNTNRVIVLRRPA